MWVWLLTYSLAWKQTVSRKSFESNLFQSDSLFSGLADILSSYDGK